jgi:hypothetical protein
VTLVTVSIAEIKSMVTDLSPAVAGAVSEVRRRVQEAVAGQAVAADA